MKAKTRTAFGTKVLEFPKDSSIKIREIINRARGEDFGLSYQVIIPTRITGRQRVRKQFAELGSAKEFAKSQFKGKEEFGSQFFELDGKKMREAQLAMAELPPGHSLLDAVREYTKQLKRDKRNPISVDEAVSTYVKTLKKLNKRERTIEDLRYRLNLFGSTFGKWKIDTIRQEDIEEWLESHSRLSPRSLKNFRNSVSSFFGWAKKQKYISENPAQEVEVPQIDWKPPVILTVEESKKLFQTAEDDERHRALIPFLVLAAFAGLRTAEISRLDWSSVNIKRKQVTIGVDQAKKRRLRTVDLLPNAVAWLKKCPNREGGVTPRNFYHRLAKLRTDAGFQHWKGEKANALRHSFGSYDFALHQDAGKTASKLGHKADDSQLFDHYRSLVDRSQARAYFKIQPSKV
jgi:site-specific recombinase XerD